MPGAVDPAAGQPADGPQAEAGHRPSSHQRRRIYQWRRTKLHLTAVRAMTDITTATWRERWERNRSGPGKVARSLQSRTRGPTTDKGVSHGALRNAAATDPLPGWRRVPSTATSQVSGEPQSVTHFETSKDATGGPCRAPSTRQPANPLTDPRRKRDTIPRRTNGGEPR